MPHAGQLKEVVDWYQPVRTARGSGQMAVTGRKVRTVRARVVESRGAVDDPHAQQVPVHTHRVEFRGRTVDVRHDWWAVWRTGGGLRLEVVTAAPLADAGTGFVVVYAKAVLPST